MLIQLWTELDYIILVIYNYDYGSVKKTLGRVNVNVCVCVSNVGNVRKAS